jgi:methionine-rich copper-binding protein CopC
MWAGTALSHATPEESDPGAGAELHQFPSVVSVRFDSELEPLFSRLIVKDAEGRQISDGSGTVAPSNARMLVARLTGRTKGIYHVYWSVVSRDGHRTEGDYTFTVD